MKENPYDKEQFFEKYAQMNRSIQGLAGAGEWETMKTLMPNLSGKRLLDLGCGYGWHCIYAMEQGASSAVGVDISEKMLEVARQKTSFTDVSYLCSAMEDISFPENSFDIVFSSLAFHYLESINELFKTVYSILKPGGVFLFSVEHPVFTAQGSQDWYRNDLGEILHFPVDNYFRESNRTACFLGENIVKYHRTLTTYLNTLLLEGFQIKSIVEPQPSEKMLAEIQEMKDELRRPMMLIISSVK